MEERITIRLTTQLLEKINNMAAQKETSASRLIREALAEFVRDLV